MLRTLRNGLFGLAVLFGLFSATPPASAAYPDRPIHWLIGFSAGGPVDIVARIMAQWLSERLGQQVIVENRTGSGGNIAAAAAISSPPDGYTLLFVAPNNAISTSLYKKLPFDFLRDTVPVASIMQLTNMLVVSNAFPPKTVQEFIDYCKANPGKISPVDLDKFIAAVKATPVVVTTPATPLPSQAKKGISPLIILFVMCGLTVLLGIAFGAFYLLRNRGTGTSGPATPAMQAQEAARQAQWTDYSATEAAPIAQFMASYKVGDDLFDDSFSIDSPSGEFLGECGVGISETIGVGDPKKVTAFEVWLFDKNDIQTVTKVLMSAHAFNDPGIRARLQAKGEPVQLEAGNQTVLETATLRMTTRVVDMNYGEGALPDKSFLESLILEIAVWPK